MFDVGHKELDNILVQINQAIDNHDQWYHQLVRTLTCKLRPDQADLAEDSHKLCRFGQWYYQDSNPALHNHPTFAAIESEHRVLHEQATILLKASMGEESIDVRSYDRFANTLERLRLQLFSLRHEIEGDLNNIDPLTGAYNRFSMLPVLREQQQLVARGVSSCSLAMLDIDFFKRVNDQYGHRVGDYALAHIASAMLRSLRPYDKLFRYGGEEFVMMFPNTPLEMALLVAERMRQHVESSPVDIREQSLGITVSIGLAAIDANVSVETSIGQADSAMYAAKQNGRNRVKLWESSLPSK